MMKLIEKLMEKWEKFACTSLHVFDFDDTLAKTDCKALVRDEDGEVIERISSSEFNKHKLDSDNHQYDIYQFDYVLDPQVIEHVFNTLKKCVNKRDCYATILTARPHNSKNDIEAFLAYNGIDPDDAQVVTLDSNVANRKKEWIEKHKGEFEDIIYYENSDKHIEAVSEIESVTIYHPERGEIR